MREGECTHTVTRTRTSRGKKRPAAAQILWPTASEWASEWVTDVRRVVVPLSYSKCNAFFFFFFFFDCAKEEDDDDVLPTFCSNVPCRPHPPLLCSTCQPSQLSNQPEQKKRKGKKWQGNNKRRKKEKAKAAKVVPVCAQILCTQCKHSLTRWEGTAQEEEEGREKEESSELLLPPFSCGLFSQTALKTRSAFFFSSLFKSPFL